MKMKLTSGTTCALPGNRANDVAERSRAVRELTIRILSGFKDMTPVLGQVFALRRTFERRSVTIGTIE